MFQVRNFRRVLKHSLRPRVMIEFRAAIESYRDSDGLMGNKPSPEKWSNGNAILDSAIAEMLSGVNFFDAVGKCQVNFTPGVFDKNPNRPDEISHDDMIGAAYLYAGEVALHALHNEWILSNTGKFYWDAWVRPWHRDYYLLMARQPSNLLYRLLFALLILHDGFFNKKDSSGKKLVWFMIIAVQNKSKIIDWCGSVWWKQTQKHWGSMKNVFTTYYGAEHPFSRYATC